MFRTRRHDRAGQADRGCFSAGRPALRLWLAMGLALCLSAAGPAGCKAEPDAQPPQTSQVAVPLPAGMVRLVLRRVTWIAGEPAVESVLRPMDQLPAAMQPDARSSFATAANGLVWRWTDPQTWKQIEDRGLIRDVSWAGAPSSTLLMPGWVGRLDVRRSLMADRTTRLSLADATGQREQIDAVITGSGCFASYQVFVTGEKQVELTPYFLQDEPGGAIVLADLRCRLVMGGEVVYVLTAVASPVFEAGGNADETPAQPMSEIFMGPSLTAHGSRRVGLVFSLEGT